MKRVPVFIVFLSLWVAILVGKLYVIQIQNHDYLSKIALNQHVEEIKIRLNRGIITDRNGNNLVLNQRYFSVYIRPDEILDHERVLQVLTQVLPISRRSVEDKLKSAKPFVWVKRKALNPVEAQRLLAEQLSGVYTHPEDKRVYPHSNLAGSVIGFVGIDNQGLEGLEYKYDRYLAGETVKIPFQRDGKQRPMWLGMSQPSAVYNNKTLVLSLDLYAQFTAEEILRRHIKATRARRGLLVGMDPFTGEILFHAQFPTIDPEHYEHEVNNPAARAAGAARWVFEPGSTFKPLIAALALEHHPNLQKESYHGGWGKIQVFGATIHDHDSYGPLNFQEILIYSSNVGAIQLGLKLPPREFANGFETLGIGKKTDVDYPGELTGYFPSLRRWVRITPAYLSIGQGMSVNALQLMKFYAAIANGGFIVTPRFARSWQNSEGKVLSLLKIPHQRIMKQTTSQNLTNILEQVVEKGTGKRARLRDYRVAGKTGTAQKIGSSGGYETGRYIASFIGFFPVSQPRILIFVMLDEPQGKFYGGEVAAPIFQEMALSLSRIWQVPPDRDSTGDSSTLIAKEETQPMLDRKVPMYGAVWADEAPLWKNWQEKPLEDILIWARKNDVKIAIYGHGTHVIYQLPPPGTPLSVRHGMIWLEPVNQVTRPSFEAGPHEIYTNRLGNPQDFAKNRS